MYEWAQGEGRKMELRVREMDADRREAAFAPTPIDVGADRLLTFLIRSSHHALEKSAMAPSHLAHPYLRLLDLLRSKPTNCHYQKR